MDFQIAIPETLRYEGGFQRDRRDLGNWVGDRLVGTKYGIAARYYPDEDIRNLTIARAVEIYRRDFWAAAGVERLPAELRFTVFDMAVNAGVTRAIKGLQVLSQFPDPTLAQLRQAVDCMLNVRCADRIGGLAIDGVMGPFTARAARNVKLSEYTALRVAYYERVATFRKNRVFLRTWLRRARHADEFTRRTLAQTT